MDKKYSLVEMFLTEVSIEDLRSQWVDSKKMSPEQFDTICKAANNKSSWVTWFGKRILDRQLSLKPEDISKWQEIINLFERYKQRFTYKDINQVKTRDQISQFVDQALKLRGEANAKDQATKAAKDQFSEFYRGSIEVDGKTFKVYVLPKGRTDLYKVSRAIAGDTHWCTASSQSNSWFKRYITDDDLIILINNSDPAEKYQVHIKSGSFMDRTDTALVNSNEGLYMKVLDELIKQGIVTSGTKRYNRNKDPEQYRDKIGKAIGEISKLGWKVIERASGQVSGIDSRILKKISVEPDNTVLTIMQDMWGADTVLSAIESKSLWDEVYTQKPASTVYFVSNTDKIIYVADNSVMDFGASFAFLKIFSDGGKTIEYVWENPDDVLDAEGVKFLEAVRNLLDLIWEDNDAVKEIGWALDGTYRENIESLWDDEDEGDLFEEFNPVQKARLQYLAGILK